MSENSYDERAGVPNTSGTFGTPCRERLEVAAYLGCQPARASLGAAAPPTFGLPSMRFGGDRRWRRAMRTLGHLPAAVAAVAIAELALDAYRASPDSPPEVESLAREAVGALQAWRCDPHSETLAEGVRVKAGDFCLAVDVGGRLSRETGYRGRALGRVVGSCYSVILAPENPRYVRWLGEAAETTCKALGVPEPRLCAAVAGAMLPFAWPAGDRKESR